MASNTGPHQRTRSQRRDIRADTGLPSATAGVVYTNYDEESRTIEATWDIPDYLDRESLVYIESTEIKAPAPYDNFVWKLKVYPIGKSFISPHLMLLQGPRKVTVKFMFETLDTPFGKLNKKSEQTEKEFKMGKEHAVYCLDFEPRQLPFNGRTPGLIVKALIQFVDFKQVMSDDMVLQSKEDLYQTFERIYQSEQYADVVFEVEGKTIMAHKMLIAARSPVLAAMFESKLVEAESHHVQITDIEYKVMKCLLQYIYTGDVNSAVDGLDCAIKLYEAADKYDLLKLRDAMEEYVMYNLTREFAVRALIASHLHNSIHLKRTAIKYIVDRNLQGFEDWTELNCFNVLLKEIDDERLSRDISQVNLATTSRASI